MVVSANGLRDGEKEELADLAQDARRFSKQTLRRYQNGHRELVLITHSNSNFLRSIVGTFLFSGYIMQLHGHDSPRKKHMKVIFIRNQWKRMSKELGDMTMRIYRLMGVNSKTND